MSTSPRPALSVLQPRNLPNVPSSPSPLGNGAARSRHHSRRSSAENVEFAKGLAPLLPVRSAARPKPTPAPAHTHTYDNTLNAGFNHGKAQEIKEEQSEPAKQPDFSGFEAADLGRRLQLLSQVDEERSSEIEEDIEDLNTRTFSTPYSSSTRASTPSLGSPLAEHRALTMTPLSSKTEAEAMLTAASSSNTSYGDDSVVLSNKEAARVFVEEALEEELVPCLQPKDIAFFERNLTRDREPTNEEVRSIVAASFPYLKHPPPKPRNPNAPPSASLPPKASAAEQAARIASLVIGLEDVETRSVLKGQVVLESRQPAWKIVEVLNASKVDPSEEVADLASMPNPWLLPIDAPALLAAARGGAKVKRTFELPDFRVKAACTACAGSRVVHDDKTDECFACEGKGVRAGAKCEFCKEAKRLVTCADCEGAGVAIYGFTVEVKLRLLDLPPIKVAALIGDRAGVSCFEVRELARAKVMRIIDQICLDSARRAAPVIAVMASVTWEHSLVRTYSVLRPLHIKLLKPQRSQPALSTAHSTLSPHTPPFKPIGSTDAVETRYYAVPSYGAPWDRKLRSTPSSPSPRSASGSSQAPRSRSASVAGFFYPDVPAESRAASEPGSTRSSNGNAKEKESREKRMRRNSIASLFMRREKHAAATPTRGSLDDVQQIAVLAVAPAAAARA